MRQKFLFLFIALCMIMNPSITFAKNFVYDVGEEKVSMDFDAEYKEYKSEKNLFVISPTNSNYVQSFEVIDRKAIPSWSEKTPEEIANMYFEALGTANSGLPENSEIILEGKKTLKFQGYHAELIKTQVKTPQDGEKVTDLTKFIIIFTDEKIYTFTIYRDPNSSNPNSSRSLDQEFEAFMNTVSIKKS